MSRGRATAAAERRSTQNQIIGARERHGLRQRPGAPQAGRPTLHPDLLRSFVRIIDCRDFADELATLPDWVLAEFGTSRAAVLAFANRLGRDALARFARQGARR